jgi:hypothetical protein
MRSVIGERLRNCSGEKSGISLLRLAAVGPDHTARLRCLCGHWFFRAGIFAVQENNSGRRANPTSLIGLPACYQQPVRNLWIFTPRAESSPSNSTTP